MPGRSGRDEKQDDSGTLMGTLRQFGKSLGLIHDDPDPPNATPPPTTPTPVKTPIAAAADKLQGREAQVDAAVDGAQK